MSGFLSFDEHDRPSLNGKFLAVVVDNNDPRKIQRIKVRIPTKLDGPTEMLPWIGLEHSPGQGFKPPDIGSICVPVIGSEVVVEFQNGDAHYGIATGSMQSARVSLPAELLENYPNRRGFKDNIGNILYIDNTEGSSILYFQHSPSGTVLEINNDGDVRISSGANSNKILFEIGSSSIEMTPTGLKLKADRIDLN